MNFRKFRKNVKALSPVVASIILIAITVAVAAWMGGMSIGFMQTEQLTITQAQFTAGGGMVITVSNTGTNAITISTIQVNGVAPSGTTLQRQRWYCSIGYNYTCQYSRRNNNISY